MKVIHGHASSRYDKPPSTLADQVGRATGADSPANLLTWTEVGDPDRAEKLKAEGWGRYVPHGETDCGIMWLKADYPTVVHKAVKRLTDKSWKDGQGHKHYQDATTVVLDHRAGVRVWVSLIHLPSGVQDGKKFATDNDDNVAAWKGAVNSWPDYHRQQVDKWGIDLTLYVADWNVDHKLADWRDYLGDRFPQCDPTWTKPFPNGGTHGDRLIDATWTDGNVTEAVLLDKREGTSDHRPFGEIITRAA